MEEKKRRVAVIGGLGFLGSKLCPLLAKEGYEVIIFDNISGSCTEKVEFPLIQGDVREKRLLNLLPEDINTIIHLAAYTPPILPESVPLEPCWQINVRGLMNTVFVGMKKGVERFVYVSDLRVKVGGDWPCSYIASRMAAENLVRGISSFFTVTIVRMAYLYGPGGLRRRDPITRLFQSVALRRETTLPPFYLEYNLLYVEDAAEALVEVLKHPINATLGLGGEVLCYIAIAHLIKRIGKRFLITATAPPKGSPPNKWPEANAHTLKWIKWKPKTSFGEGAGKTLQWFEERRHLLPTPRKEMKKPEEEVERKENEKEVKANDERGDRATSD